MQGDRRPGLGLVGSGDRASQTVADGGRLRDGARLAAVRATGMLDGAPDEDLQRIAEMAGRLLGVPVSLVSLVDERRQVFPAQTGLAEPWATAAETPLSHSFCQHVVDRDAALVIEDATQDPLVADNLAIRDLDVTAYAGVPLRNEEGQPLGALCAIDSKPREWSEADLQILSDLARLASQRFELEGYRAGAVVRDPVSGLPGRAVFFELVERGLRVSARRHVPAALVALDVYGFGLINDALGFDTGDLLLERVGSRLVAALRPGDALCRIAGDEFMVFCPGVEDEADGLRIAHRLIGAISGEPFTLPDGSTQALAIKAGVAIATERVNATELASVARERLASAKRGPDATARKGTAQGQAETRLAMRNAVVQAHRRGEMSLVYQPLARLDTLGVVAYEALLRWNHPKLGAVPPDTFIPAAEETGAIVDIGEWVIEQACTELAAWRRMSGEDLHVAINVAPEQIGVPVFAQTVASILDETGVPPEALTLEITERTLLSDRPTHVETVRALREHGVRIALDDFGTGYSALSYLTRFPLDELKIDRSFVAGLLHDSPTRMIIKGIVDVARNLGLRTVAEGIEEPAQLDRLIGLGCDLGQGYHLSRPISAAAVRDQIEQENR